MRNVNSPSCSKPRRFWRLNSSFIHNRSLHCLQAPFLYTNRVGGNSGASRLFDVGQVQSGLAVVWGWRSLVISGCGGGGSLLEGAPRWLLAAQAACFKSGLRAVHHQPHYNRSLPTKKEEPICPNSCFQAQRR